MKGYLNFVQYLVWSVASGTIVEKGISLKISELLIFYHIQITFLMLGNVSQKCPVFSNHLNCKLHKIVKAFLNNNTFLVQSQFFLYVCFLFKFPFSLLELAILLPGKDVFKIMQLHKKMWLRIQKLQFLIFFLHFIAPNLK